MRPSGSFIIRKKFVSFHNFLFSICTSLSWSISRVHSSFAQVLYELESKSEWNVRKQFCWQCESNELNSNRCSLRKKSLKQGKKYFWSTICWFIVSIIHIVIDGVLIAFDWTEGRWLHVVVICFITWELFIFCFMVTFKALFCTIFVATKTLETENSENGTPAVQRKVVEA